MCFHGRVQSWIHVLSYGHNSRVKFGKTQKKKIISGSFLYRKNRSLLFVFRATSPRIPMDFSIKWRKIWDLASIRILIQISLHIYCVGLIDDGISRPLFRSGPWITQNIFFWFFTPTPQSFNVFFTPISKFDYGEADSQPFLCLMWFVDVLSKRAENVTAVSSPDRSFGSHSRSRMVKTPLNVREKSLSKHLNKAYMA